MAFVREITGEFPAQSASNAENVSIWWRHHVIVHDVESHHYWVYLVAKWRTILGRFYIYAQFI